MRTLKKLEHRTHLQDQHQLFDNVDYAPSSFFQSQKLFLRFQLLIPPYQLYLHIVL